MVRCCRVMLCTWCASHCAPVRGTPFVCTCMCTSLVSLCLCVFLYCGSSVFVSVCVCARVSCVSMSLYRVFSLSPKDENNDEDENELSEEYNTSGSRAQRAAEPQRQQRAGVRMNQNGPPQQQRMVRRPQPARRQRRRVAGRASKFMLVCSVALGHVADTRT